MPTTCSLSKFPFATSPMSISNVRYNPPPPALPPPKLVPVHSSRKVDSLYDFNFYQNDKDQSLWRDDEPPRPYPPPPPPPPSLLSQHLNLKSREQGQLSPCRNSILSSTSSNMNSILYKKTQIRIQEGHENSRGLDLPVSSNRIEGKGHVEFPTIVIPTRFQAHDKFQTILQAYDKEMLSKLDTRRKNDSITPPSNHGRPFFSSTTVREISPTSNVGFDHSMQLRPLSVPVMPTKSSSIWSESVRTSTSSCNHLLGLGETESHIDTNDSDKFCIPSNLRYSSSGPQLSTDDLSINKSRSHKHSDQRISPMGHDEDFQEETGLRRLIIDEYVNNNNDNINNNDNNSNNNYTGFYSPTASSTGKKRRASSPVDDEGPSLFTGGTSNDYFRRRESAASRNSVGSRFHSHSGSISSTTSDNRNNSLASTLSITASSLTSVGSLGRLSPGGISPRCIESIESPRTISSSNTSPRGSISKNFNTHQSKSMTESKTFVLPTRQLSESTTTVAATGLNQPLNRSATNLQGVFMCECCPKKPKKFDTQEDLNAHEQEKQYECAYCRNRFKNKNEAERHQNSLHLRRHSWSCAALSGYAAAFHNSPSQPNEADTCGYCGEDFPRSGMRSGKPFITEHDWELRVNHLTEMHKFGECNHAKKFFRADHFRQHLKHSHSGTSGKWTNMLENACMKDEPLPETIRGPERVNPGNQRVGRVCETKGIFQVGETITKLGQPPPKILKVT